MASVDGAPPVTPKILTLRSDINESINLVRERERERERERDILGYSGLLKYSEHGSAYHSRTKGLKQ